MCIPYWTNRSSSSSGSRFYIPANTQSERQQLMDQVVESLLPTWEPWSEFPAAGFGLAKPLPLQTFGGVNQHIGALSLHYFVSQITKKKKKIPFFVSICINHCIKNSNNTSESQGDSMSSSSPNPNADIMSRKGTHTAINENIYYKGF